MEVEWDGITRVDTLAEWSADVRQRLADHAKAYNWKGVFALLAEHSEFVNSTRPGGGSWYAPLHQAAHGGAPVEIVERLVEIGAWRGLRNARGERPVDVATRMGHTHLTDPLTPVIRTVVQPEALAAIQFHLHTVIRQRAADLVDEHALRLPELEFLMELDDPAFWFPVPGMYGGFNCRLDHGASGVILVAESWCRVVGGSGQRHEITPSGAVLVDEGFV